LLLGNNYLSGMVFHDNAAGQRRHLWQQGSGRLQAGLSNITVSLLDANGNGLWMPAILVCTTNSAASGTFFTNLFDGKYPWWWFFRFRFAGGRRPRPRLTRRT
jgi:hypothetical protein